MRPYRYHIDLQLFNQEKTEKATPKKKKESREKGQVARSADMPASFILLLVFASFMMLGGHYKQNVFFMFQELLEHWLLYEVTPDNVLAFMFNIALKMLLALAPIFAIAFVVAIIGNVAQFGFLLTNEPLKMKLSKLNPLQGFKQIFSLRSLVEFAKSVLKLLVIGLMVYSTLSGEWENFLLLNTIPVAQAFAYAANITIKLGLQIGALLIVLAIADYMYQRYDHAKKQRMSKQDIRDEYKKSEGDPLIKSKIKERQRRMAMQRMMQDVPSADVIITNPTHYAVALKYDGSQMEAPMIVAKGTGYVALRIREIAKEHDVMTMENKPLARALYHRAEIGDAIPGDLFQAVAEVLALVYKMKQPARRR